MANNNADPIATITAALDAILADVSVGSKLSFDNGVTATVAIITDSKRIGLQGARGASYALLRDDRMWGLMRLASGRKDAVISITVG